MKSELVFISKIFWKVGSLNIEISKKLNTNISRSTMIKKGNGRNLYKTIYNDYYWLNQDEIIDKCIMNTGIFDNYGTEIVKKLVKNGDVVLDVGANSGYYSVLFSKLVGSSGKVLAFEPTDHFGKVLKMNLEVNKIYNCEVFEIGLSNKKQTVDIHIGDSTATIHVPGKTELTAKERINLVPLDDFFKDYKINKIDFIKVDIDGHEPFFMEGAFQTLEKYSPIIFLEISPRYYFEAGVTAWDFFKMLKNKDYKIYTEDSLKEILTLEEFLYKCGNFNSSVNIVISKKQIIF